MSLGEGAGGQWRTEQDRNSALPSLLGLGQGFGISVPGTVLGAGVLSSPGTRTDRKRVFSRIRKEL